MEGRFVCNYNRNYTLFYMCTCLYIFIDLVKSELSKGGVMSILLIFMSSIFLREHQMDAQQIPAD